jgi:peptidyl-prolyl cis-trans isomerase B (cyclophilin B)
MKKLLCALIACISINAAAQTPPAKIQVSMMTSKGEMVFELDSAKAPLTVKNFLDYVNTGFYEGTIFHRVIKGFMVQGGGMTPDMNLKKANAPIQNEAGNRLSNRRGTIAMARTGEPHSATCQFFINVVNNYNLDFKNTSVMGWGYCVFGKVIKGMAVADAIAEVQTGPQDVPVTPIVITKVSVLKTPIAPETK